MVIRSKAPVRIDFAGGWTDVDVFARGAGGAVLNATIDKYVTGRLEMLESDAETTRDEEGISVSYRSDLPAGSGLGTSATLNVVWLSLIKSQLTSAEDRKIIAELAYNLERMLGILGGRQDQYASALGGFNFMRFDETVTTEPLDLSPQIISTLEERLILCYTGKPRLSGSIHENVWGAYRQGVPDTVNALYNLRNVAIRMKTVLLNGDLEEFPLLLNQNWKHQKQLDASTTNDQIEELFQLAFREGAIGGKACGAGGGGCLLFFCDAGRSDAVKAALTAAGTRIIEFHFEFEGLQVWVEG